MNELKFWVYATSVGILTNYVISLPFRFYRRWRKLKIDEDKYMISNQPLQNLSRLAHATFDELPPRVCTSRVHRLVNTFTDPRVWGYKSGKESLKNISEILNGVAIGAGIAVAASLSAYITGNCLLQSQGNLTSCLEEYGTFFTEGTLGATTIALALVVYRISNGLFKICLEDHFEKSRFQLLSNEYQKMSETLMGLVESAEKDPKTLKKTQIFAKKLLRNIPAIKKELCCFAALSEIQAQSLVLPLETLSRRVSQSEKVD
jgi:hypothetical protein